MADPVVNLIFKATDQTKGVIGGLGSALGGLGKIALGVAAGAIGAIKSLEQLRSVAAHVGAIVLPTPVSVANVQSVFDTAGHISNPGIETSIRGVASNVMEYIHGTVCPRVTLERLMRQGAVAVA